MRFEICFIMSLWPTSFFFSQEADKMLVYDMNDVSDDDGSFLACSLVAVETDF